jgi:nicotinic acid mononucleotide adenylyltransferase
LVNNSAYIFPFGKIENVSFAMEAAALLKRVDRNCPYFSFLVLSGFPVVLPNLTMQIDPHLLQHYRHIAAVLANLRPQGEPWAAVSPRSEEPRGDIIVFPGSFNPPTLAHLEMLRQARKFANRREGGHWRIYAALSRHIVDKEAVERMTLLDRVVLLERVLAGHVRHAGILLLNRGLYVEQAQGIRAAFPRVRRLRFLVGFDKLVQILDPRYYDRREQALRELFALAELLVAPRGSDGEHEVRELLARTENRPFARFIRLLPLEEPYRNMSSTQARASATLDAVPREVHDFIQRTRPYASPLRQADGSERDLYAERTHTLQRLLASGAAGT